jgi:hypothetical protein
MDHGTSKPVITVSMLKVALDAGSLAVSSVGVLSHASVIISNKVNKNAGIFFMFVPEPSFARYEARKRIGSNADLVTKPRDDGVAQIRSQTLNGAAQTIRQQQNRGRSSGGG